MTHCDGGFYDHNEVSGEVEHSLTRTPMWKTPGNLLIYEESFTVGLIYAKSIGLDKIECGHSLIIGLRYSTVQQNGDECNLNARKPCKKRRITLNSLSDSRYLHMSFLLTC